MYVVYFNCNWIGFLFSECFFLFSVISRNVRGLNVYFIICLMIIDFYFYRFLFDLLYYILVFRKVKLLLCKFKLICDRFII